MTDLLEIDLTELIDFDETVKCEFYSLTHGNKECLNEPYWSLSTKCKCFEFVLCNEHKAIIERDIKNFNSLRTCRSCGFTALTDIMFVLRPL